MTGNTAGGPSGRGGDGAPAAPGRPEALEASRERFQLLAAALERLAAADTRDEVIGIVRDGARRLAGADGASVVLREGDHHCLHAGEDPPAGPPGRGGRFPLTSCVAGWAMLHRRTAVVEDVRADERVPSRGEGEACEPASARSLVAVPVGGREPSAAVAAYWSEPRRPHAEEVAVLESLARASGAALDRCEAEERLRASERRFRALAELSPDGIIIAADAGGRIAYANPAALRLAGAGEPGQVLGRPPLDFVPPERHGHVRERIVRALGGLSSPLVGTSVRRLDGREVAVEMAAGPVAWEGAPAVQVLVRDVSERERAGAALRASEERLRLVVRATNDAVMDWDLGTDRIAWSEAVRSVFGYGEDALHVPGGWWKERVHPDERDGVLRDLDRALAGDAEHWAREYRFRRADGGYANVVDRCVILRDDAGRARRVTGSLLDVTERKAAEEALRRSEERFRQFAEATDDVLWIVDAERMRLEYASPAFEAVWGESRDAVMADLGRWAELIHPEDRGRAAGGLPTVLREGAFEQEYRIVRASDGAVRWIRDKGFAVRGPDGRARRVVGLARDITARREGDERQVVLLQELAHRVKNTLAVILAMAQQTGLRAADLEGFLGAFEGRVRALAAAHDLLTDNGWRSTPVSALAAAALAAHGEGPGGAAAGRFRIEVADDVTLAPAAAQSLVLALHELATNATKHGALSRPGGRVTLEGRVEGDELVLAWREAGGPPVAAAPTPAGAGFGTALLRQVVAYQHDGRVEAEWRPEGLACTLRLPLARVTARADAA